MKKLVAAAAVLLLAGCASIPAKQQAQHHQVNRAKKADKNVSPAKRQGVSTPAATSAGTPNQVIAKRWYDGFKVRWFH